ncbi:MAG: phage portal protein [Oribacterium sp.]|nr:phage portal protein [Oribacterium sp.]
MMNDVFRVNNPDILFDNAILSALIGSCSFMYIIPQGPEQNPRIQVIDGRNATGQIDQTTGLLTEGYAVLERDDDNETVLIDAYFTAGKIEIWEKGAKNPKIVRNKAKYPLLVPVIHRPDAARPFGHSRITRACMNLQDKARHTMTRADVAAEFGTIPQKYVIGLDEDAERFENWKQTASTMMDFRTGENGEKVSVGQFAQISMEPHLNQLKMYVSAFSGETGMTMDDLGFPSENPASSEAIKAAHETLRLAARKAQRNFGTGFLNAGYLAACVRDGEKYDREVLAEARCRWAPIFEPDLTAISLIGDGIQKLTQAAPGYIGWDNLQGLTGIERSRDPF